MVSRYGVVLSVCSGLLVVAVSAQAQEKEASPFSANVTLTSDYVFRGISQTDEKPAIQGGMDFKHPSGFYVGTWASSISWLRDAERGTGESSSSSMELDIYGGYTHQFGDIGIDVGLLQYYYPGNYSSKWNNATGLDDPHTLEGYAGISWKFLSFKYSHAFTDLFGTPNSRHSKYYDLSASYEVLPNLSLDAHVGRQQINGGDSYTDWRAGATYNWRQFNVGLHYTNTNMDDKSAANADGRVVLSLGAAF